MIGFIGGCGRKDERGIAGDITMKIGTEQHKIIKSSLVYVPPGVDHCPVEFKNMTKPVLLFTVGNAKKWTQVRK
jgi:mannose-6-phosphate isomerase-like protein (cupin superfamily)